MVGNYGSRKDWILTMPGGVACTNHDLPLMPQAVKGFAMAQAYRRYLYICGGFQFGDNNEPPASCKCSCANFITLTRAFFVRNFGAKAEM